MSRKLVLVMSLTIVLIGLLGVAFRVERVEAGGTITINADGSIDPPTANITSADNITYIFTGNINDEIVVERDNIVVEGAGYTVQKTRGYRGILLSGINNVTIKNMRIHAFSYAIDIKTSSNISISGNNITNSHYGILLHTSSNATISENNLADNSVVGIGLSGSSNNTVSGNNIMNSTYGITLGGNNNYVYGNNITNSFYGIKLKSCSNNFLHANLLNGNQYGFDSGGGWGGLSHYLHFIDTSNLVDGKPVYYLISQHSLTINPSTHPEVGYLALINSTNITVEGLTLIKNVQGLLIAYTNNTKIQNNNIINNKYGVTLCSSSNNRVHGNNITNNKGGIGLDEASNNSISGNNITANNWTGIALDYSSNNTVSGNNITNNNGGIVVEESSNNTIFHNNFIGNACQVYDYSWDSPLGPSVNIWDHGFEGNYWSNYTGVDSDYDGIGDTVHIIYANNTDNYPLMGVFSDFPVTHEEETYHVATICSSILSEFQFSDVAKTISFNVTGPDYTLGFCRVTVPNIIVQDLWQGNYTVLVDGEEPIMTNNWTDGTYTYVYFKYLHSEHKVEIIPEFPTWTSILLILTVLTVAIAFYKRRLLKTPIH